MRIRISIMSLLLIAASAILPGISGWAETEKDRELQSVLSRVSDLVQKKQFDEAIKELKNASRERNDKSPECFQAMGKIYYMTGKFKESSEVLRQAVALEPDSPELLNFFGLSLYAQDNKKLYAEASGVFQRAIELSNGKYSIMYYSLGYSLIKGGKEEEGLAALKKYLEANPEAANAHEVKEVIANPRFAYEKFAPNFKVTTLAGEEISLEKYKGKIVLIDFWATWCPPCRAEMPYLKKVWQKYGKENFVIIGINMDNNRNAVEQYMAKEGVTWQQYFDGGSWDNKVARLYNVHSIPSAFLLDEHGIVRASGLRGEELSSKVGELLKKLSKSK